MSGGHFNYLQLHLLDIKEQLSYILNDPENLEHIKGNISDTEHYSQEENYQATVDGMVKLKEDIQELFDKIHALDYFLSGDSDVQGFLEKINKR